jgi:hypothetical protein
VLAFQSPNYLGLINLDWTVYAPRPFRAWQEICCVYHIASAPWGAGIISWFAHHLQSWFPSEPPEIAAAGWADPLPRKRHTGAHRPAPARAIVDHLGGDIVVRAYVAICTPIGQEIVTVHVEDYDPFITLSVHGQILELTRTESRQVADALRAAALRYSNEQLQGDALE